MTTIQTDDATGAAIVFATPACLPAPRKGYTVREVDALPPSGGQLV